MKKGQLNRIIDLLIHNGKPSKDFGTVCLDELLHTLVEGEFRLDKLVRYHIVPLIKPKKRTRKGRRKR